MGVFIVDLTRPSKAIQEAILRHKEHGDRQLAMAEIKPWAEQLHLESEELFLRYMNTLLLVRRHDHAANMVIGFEGKHLKPWATKLLLAILILIGLGIVVAGSYGLYRLIFIL